MAWITSFGAKILFLGSLLFLIFFFRENQKKNPKIKKVKIAFIVSNENNKQFFIASQKKTKKHKKNGLMEFPGGRLEKNEFWKDGLVRELKEEDPTENLAKGFLEFSSFELFKHHKTYIVVSRLSWDRWIHIQNSNSNESYGFFLVPKDHVDDFGPWTKKSLSLLRHLKENQSSFFR